MVRQTQPIKPISATQMPQLSTAKPRCGLQSISDLVPRLLKQYDAQAQLLKEAESQNRREQQQLRREQKQQSTPVASAVTFTVTTAPTQQTTFGWE